MQVAAGASKGAPHGEESTRVGAHARILSELIEGRLWSADGRAALVNLATRRIVEEALEAESRDALGRDFYEHGASPGLGWRNGVTGASPRQ